MLRALRGEKPEPDAHVLPEVEVHFERNRRTIR